MTAFFAAGMVAVVAALGATLPLRGEYPIGWALGWAGMTLVSVATGTAVRSRLAERVASAPGPAEAVDRYTARLIAGLAFAEFPVLAGAAVAFWVDGLLPALIALPVSLALLLWTAPTEADVRRVQDRVAAAGRELDVAAALLRPTSAP
jgi:hypothetical protein